MSSIDVGDGPDLDEKVKVSANDTTAAFLDTKLVAGAGITLTEQDDGLNESLEIAAPGSTTDELVKVSANDTTPGVLNGKLTAGANVSLVEVNDGANEALVVAATDTNTTDVDVLDEGVSQGIVDEIDFVGAGVTATVAAGVATVTIPAAPAGSDVNVKVSADDTTTDFLLPKLQAGANITLNEINPGGDEKVEIVATDTNTTDVTLKDEGTPVTGTPHSTLNFVGAGVVVTNLDGTEATVTISGAAGTKQTFVWRIRGNITSNSDVDDVLLMPADGTITKIVIGLRDSGSGGAGANKFQLKKVPEAGAADPPVGQYTFGAETNMYSPSGPDSRPILDGGSDRRAVIPAVPDVSAAVKEGDGLRWQIEAHGSGVKDLTIMVEVQF